MADGEVHQCTELLEDSRRHALDRMLEQPRLMGADAVIGMRFDSSEIGQSLTEIVAYGTGGVVGAGPPHSPCRAARTGATPPDQQGLGDVRSPIDRPKSRAIVCP